tara:strand:- start:95 stop:649 length:555 start_codon:yes stop_codon:yes gene_type:complete
MSNLTDFFPSGGGGGLTPKFQEFNASGTFTPSQALIDAGGYIEVFLVAGGGRGDGESGGAGGEVIMKKMYLASTTGCAVNIGAGAQAQNTSGSDSTFIGVSAGGENITCVGGAASGSQSNKLGAGWGKYNNSTGVHTAGNGVFGYGAGGGGSRGGTTTGKPNSGQGSFRTTAPGSGYCLIKWYE